MEREDYPLRLLEEIKLKELEELKAKLDKLSDIVKALGLVQRWTFDYIDYIVSMNVSSAKYKEKVEKGVSVVRKKFEYIQSLVNSL